MRIAQCRPTPGHAVLGFDAVGRLIDTVGGAAFGEALLASLAGGLGVRYVAAYAMDEADGLTHFVVGAAAGDPALLYPSTRRYVDRHAARDPARPALLRQGDAPGAVATCLGVTDLADEGHRGLLTAAGIGERVAAYVPDGRRWIGLHLMREHRLGPMNEDAFAAFATLAPVLAGFVARHVRLAAAAAPAAAETEADIGMAAPRRLAAALQRHCPTLSARERAVCEGVLAGRRAAEIAADLGVATASVHTYRERAYVKLGVRSTRELFMLQLRLVQRH